MSSRESFQWSSVWRVIMPNKTGATNIVTLEVNGRDYRVETRADERLLDLLRDRLGLMGTKEGCGIGECGACTVLMNGTPVNSCMVPPVPPKGLASSPLRVWKAQTASCIPSSNPILTREPFSAASVRPG